MSKLNLNLDARTLNPGQRKFIRSRSPYVLFSAGFGTGKTTVEAIKILQLSTENPRIPGLIVAQSYTAVKSTLLRALNKLLPQGHKLRIIDPTGERYITLDGVTPIFIRTAHNPDLMDGLDVGWVVADEIRHFTKHAYDIMIGRVRVQCPFPQLAFGSTPAVGWMSEEFDSGIADREVIFSSTFENAHNLNESYIRNLKESYSPRMWRAVVEGKFTILEGAVYEEFDDSEDAGWVTDWQPSRQYLDTHKVYLTVDPGYRRSSWQWWVERKHPEGGPEYVCFDQLALENTMDIAAVEMVNRKGPHNKPYPVDEIWHDPAAKQVQSVAAVDTRMVLRKVTPRVRNTRMLRSITAYRDVSFGVDKVRTLLGGAGLPQRLKFTKHCKQQEYRKKRGAIKSHLGYRYPDIKGGKPITDEPLKDGHNDHCCDATRYFAVGRWLAEPWLRKKLIAIGELDKKSGQGYEAA